MNKNSIFKILSVVALLVIVMISFPRHTTSFQYYAEVGRPWGYESLTAEYDFPIYKTQEQLDADYKQVLRDFTPYFTFVGAERELIISHQDYSRLEKDGYTSISVVDGNVSTMYPLSDIYTPKSAYEVLHVEHSEPTLAPDTAMTNRMRQSLISSVSLTSGMVQAGEKIIDKGDIVTEESQNVLESYRRIFEESELSFEQKFMALIGESFLLIVFVLMSVLFLIVYRPFYLKRVEDVLFFCSLPALLIVLVCLDVRYTSIGVYMIPFAWVPILTRIFFDGRTAVFLHISTVLIASMVVPAPYEFLLLQLSMGLITVTCMRDLSRRSQIFRGAGIVFCIYVVVYTAYHWFATGNLQSVSASVYINFAVNAILVICSYGLIYLFERVFGVLSSITLIEMTDLNSDILHEFSETAPGSFQHSMQVSNLATDAAKAIGANSLLVRTGALYHDIGKMVHPEYYTENQQEGANPLLEMTPLEAAEIIIHHVSDGIELAQKHRVPEKIIRFITTHHGQSLVRYFYNTAANSGDNPDPAFYSYPGPKPETKEEAILMMADAVEARSRSLKDFNEKTITDAVNQMIDAQIADGQFSEANITFSDVTTIKQVFIQRLQVINHHRIKYPKLKK